MKCSEHGNKICNISNISFIRLSRDHDRRQRVEESERRSLQQAGALAVEDWDTFDMKQTIQRAGVMRLVCFFANVLTFLQRFV